MVDYRFRLEYLKEDGKISKKKWMSIETELE